MGELTLNSSFLYKSKLFVCKIFLVCYFTLQAFMESFLRENSQTHTLLQPPPFELRFQVKLGLALGHNSSYSKPFKLKQASHPLPPFITSKMRLQNSLSFLLIWAHNMLQPCFGYSFGLAHEPIVLQLPLIPLFHFIFFKEAFMESLNSNSPNCPKFHMGVP